MCHDRVKLDVDSRARDIRKAAAAIRKQREQEEREAEREVSKQRDEQKLSQFIADHCDVGHDCWAETTALMQAFERFSNTVVGHKTMAARMRGQGFATGRLGGNNRERVFRGLRLKGLSTH